MAFAVTGISDKINKAAESVFGKDLVAVANIAGAAYGITWTTSAGGFRIIGTTLPTTTVANKYIYVGCLYNAVDSFWDVVAVTTQA